MNYYAMMQAHRLAVFQRQRARAPGLPKLGVSGVGVGQPSTDLINAAQAVVDYFASNPCTQSAISQVGTFQSLYNSSGMAGQLTVDSQYGGNTQAALQAVLNAAPAAQGGGAVQTAPANCFNMVVPSVPQLDPTTSAGTIDTTQILTQTVPWTTYALVAGAVVGAGVLAYAVVKPHSKRAYRHMRRRNPLNIKRW